MPIAYSYTRFSTPEQAEGDSARRQIELAEVYAVEHGLELDTTLRLRDEGVSGFRGANVRKGALGQFLKACDDGQVPEGSYLLVESLDRVSRQSPWDALPVFQQIINEGVTIVTLFDGKTYDRKGMVENPMRILESLFVMIRANEESETKSRRMKSAWKEKRKKAASGLPMTHLTPAWIRREGSQVVLIPERASIVRRMVDMTFAGMGQHRIAETFNSEAIPVFRGGQRWHKSYVKKVIENPSIAGYLVPHELYHDEAGKRQRKALDAVANFYPPIVTEEEWSRLLALSKTKKARSRTSSTLMNMLSGLAVCGHCGSIMTRVTKGKKAKPALVCIGAKRGEGCTYRSIPMWEVEGRVRASLVELHENYPTGSTGLDQLVLRANELEANIGLFVDELVRTGPSEALSTARVAAEKELADVRVKLRDAVGRSRVVVTPDRLLDVTDYSTPAEVNAVLRGLYKEVRISSDRWQWVPAITSKQD